MFLSKRPVRAPKGLAFDLPDHEIARQWARHHGYRLIVDIAYGTEDEEYEEVLALHAGGRLRFVVWRQSDGIILQPMVGRPSRFPTVPSALAAMTPMPRRDRR